MSKVTGTVKWFSNRKGFGFISPTSSNSPTQEEIFVHQTSIFSDGAYRTLTENAEVEFVVEKEAESGKFKAVNVTAPGGGPIKPPARERRRNERRPQNKKGGAESDGKDGTAGGATSGTESGDDKPGEVDDKGQKRGRNGRRGGPKKDGGDKNGDKKEQDPPFHHSIPDDVKAKIKENGIDLGKKSTVDVAHEDARIKLGQGGYAGVALAKGVVGEGSYTCDDTGLIIFDWKRALAFTDGEWKPSEPEKLIAKLSLTDDTIGPVKPDETPESLWGSDKTDPKEAFENNGFQMRRVVLTRPPGFRGRRGGGGGNKKN